MAEKNNLIEIIKNAPNKPGVYKMIDQNNRVIYIGKAKDLKKRLKQYFQTGYQHSSRTHKMVQNIADIIYTVVDSDLEAIILEHNQIKQFQPKYNVIMKDDKNYVYIKITKEDFPRIQIVRQIEKDKAKYIGPKSSAHKVKETFKVLKKLFPFRHCGLNIELLKENADGVQEVKITNKVIKYPCLDYYIKRCAGPCIGKVAKEAYAEIIANVEMFLDGKADKIISDLQEKMITLAKNKKFEQAGKIRDKINKIESILERQKISNPDRKDTDIINYYIAGEKAYFNLFQIRDGKIIEQENFTLTASEFLEGDTSVEVLSAFTWQYYQIATDIPQEILIPHEIENSTELEMHLSQNINFKPKVLTPQRGEKNKLLEMSLSNAKVYCERNRPSWKVESENSIKAVAELKKVLALPNEPKRIECYDISHLGGTETVASMVVFENGVPKTDMYRKFKLRTVEDKPDDFKSMEEILYRRFVKIADKIRQNQFKVRAAKKSDQEFINKTASSTHAIATTMSDQPKEDKSQTSKIFILEKQTGEKNTEQAGIIELIDHSKNIAQLKNLQILKAFRGQKLGQNLIIHAIKKTSAKRIYIVCKKDLKDYYQLIGFENIKKIPVEIVDEKTLTPDQIVMAIDKQKINEDKSFSKIPDLVIIDGGKGQLNAGTKIFKQLEIKSIPYISLAKRLEEIFIPDQTVPIILDHHNEALKLLQRARDEAHRFAITFNREQRSKKMFQ